MGGREARGARRGPPERRARLPTLAPRGVRVEQLEQLDKMFVPGAGPAALPTPETSARRGGGGHHLHPTGRPLPAFPQWELFW